MGGSDFIYYQWEVLENTNPWCKTRLNVKLLEMEKMWAILRQSGGITGSLLIAHFWEEETNKIYKKTSWKPTDLHGRKEMTQETGQRHGWVTWLKEPLFLWFSSLRHTYTHNVSFAKLRCVCPVGPPRPPRLTWCLQNYHPSESIYISESTPPELDPAETMYFSLPSPKCQPWGSY